MSIAEEIFYTYEDYKEWEGDWELINGLPIAMAPSPIKKHQSIAVKLVRFLDEQLDECEQCEVLSEIDYKISEETVVRPDVVVTCDDNNEYYLVKAPKIVFEIVSSQTAKKDEIYKFALYEEEKVLYYVLIYPQDTKAKIFRHNGKKFEKVGNFFDQKYQFDGFGCRLQLDFAKVFKLQRKE